MKIQHFLCSCLVWAGAVAQAADSDRPLSSFRQAFADSSDDQIVRAQNNPVLLPPLGSTTVLQPGPYYDGGTGVPIDPNVGGGVPYSPTYPAPIPYDPWNGGGNAAYPYGANPGPSGLNGPQPYKFLSWAERLDLFYMQESGTSDPSIGDFEMWGIDFNKEFPMPIGGDWVFTPSFDYGARFLSGPRGGLTNSHLPGDMHRFGMGFKLASPIINRWGLEGSFNPWIATDFDGKLQSDAYMFDGQAAALWQWSPQTTWVLGASYWDRVDSIILPYAGVVWTPNDYWEFRLLFPKPRVTVFLGAPNGVPTWLYASGEYHVEAYEVNSLVGGSSKVQFSDWRLMGGLRWETPRVTTFIEAGYIFDRKVDFDRLGTDFDVDSGFIGRIGMRF
ncbi:MAG: hypothetical protein DWH91_05140 [Planctomycetota bacterium]|nr:MAG: hypothetical protein DWH91_05140 [Planctomycetota bacterium]